MPKPEVSLVLRSCSGGGGGEGGGDEAQLVPSAKPQTEKDGVNLASSGVVSLLLFIRSASYGLSFVIILLPSLAPLLFR